MKTHWVPIFKTGEHTSRSGVKKKFTDAHLDLAVAVYNQQQPEARHDAPACIGHPELNKPAYGFFNQLKREGELLFGELRDTKDEFVQWVRDGHYRKVSAKFDNDMLLKHVGWLGSQAPAIKGLPEFNFAEEGVGEEWDLEFSDSDPDTLSTSSEDDMGKNQAGGQAPANADKPENSGGTATGTPPATQNGSAVSGQSSGVSPQEFAEYKQQQEAEAKKLREQLAEQRQKNLQLEFSEYLNQPRMKLKVTPAMRKRVLRLMTHAADSSDVFEFAEEDSAGQTVEVKVSVIEDLKKLLEQLPDSTSLAQSSAEGEGEEEAAFSESDDKEMDAMVSNLTGGK